MPDLGGMTAREMIGTLGRTHLCQDIHKNDEPPLKAMFEILCTASSDFANFYNDQPDPFFAGAAPSTLVDQPMALTARKAPSAGREVKLCHSNVIHRTPEPPTPTEEALLLRGKQYAVVHLYAIYFVLQ